MWLYKHSISPKEWNKMKKTVKTIIILSTFLSTYSYGYECNGRHYCSEMASCEEAQWVLNNCPDPRMDGDHDGIPCEQQHCGGYHHSEIGNQNPAMRIFNNKPNTFNYLASVQTPTSTNNNQWTLNNINIECNGEIYYSRKSSNIISLSFN